jgi:hypothetical protein
VVDRAVAPAAVSLESGVDREEDAMSETAADRRPASEASARPDQLSVVGAANANRAWRAWVTRHPIGGALIAGFVATHIATIIGFWLPGIGLPQLNWPIVNGNVVLPRATSAVSKFLVGEVFIHGLDGVVFTFFFAIILFPLMGSRITPAMNFAKAMVFALLLGTLSIGFMVPYVYFPHSGAGLFTTGFGWKTVTGIYFWHLAFGINLGLMYNPMAPEDPALQVRRA